MRGVDERVVMFSLRRDANAAVVHADLRWPDVVVDAHAAAANEHLPILTGESQLTGKRARKLR